MVSAETISGATAGGPHTGRKPIARRSPSVARKAASGNRSRAKEAAAIAPMAISPGASSTVARGAPAAHAPREPIVRHSRESWNPADINRVARALAET